MTAINQARLFDWYPEDMEAYRRAVASSPWLEDSFQSIPWSLTRIKKTDAPRFTADCELVGSILAKSALAGGGQTNLSNSNIMLRMGRPPNSGKPRSKTFSHISHILSLLEGFDWIEIKRRGGKGRYIKVKQEILDAFQAVKDSPEDKALVIPPEIFLLNISWAIKRFLACRMGFQGMRVDTMAERLGLSEISIKKHYLTTTSLGILIKDEDPNPPENYTQPPRKLNIGID